MAKSKKKKYNKKKRNPNRAPQSGAVRKPSGGGAAKSGSAVSKPSPARQREMWIAIAVAVGVFLLLLLIARLSNRNNETVEPDAESVVSGESVTSGETAESVASGDAEASENAASVQSGDATDNAASADATASTGSGDSATATTSTSSGDSMTATASTGSGDSATATAPTSSAASDATASTDNAASGAQSVTSGDSATRDANAAQSADAVNATEYADIVVKDYGTITVALDGATAPITVQNFVSLAKSGFYDGLTFHRIMDGFMIQGGDPKGDGTGGAESNIVGEFKSNGIVNDISHVRGTISMARASGDENSASSQFFIVQKDSTFLDGDYAGFGHVTSGMEVVDKICADAKPIDDNGTIKPEEQPIITSVTIRDN